MEPVIMTTRILGLSAALFWGLVLAIAAIAELLTLNMVSIWFAVAALVAMIAALLDASPMIQFFLFGACSIAGFLVFILIVRPKLNKGVRTPTNADRILNKEGVVTAAIDSTAGSGLIRVEGQIWSARMQEEGAVLPEGTPVRVVGIRGVRAIVEPLD